MNTPGTQTVTPASYVNIFGDPVSMDQPKRKKEVKHREAHHDGWVAYGVSPQTVARAAALDAQFDLTKFLRGARLEKIRRAPFISASTAREACELAKRCGWHGVHYLEKKVD